MNARIGWQNLRTSEFLDSGDYMLITGTDFKDGGIDYSNIHYVDKERYEQDKKIQIQNNSILITKDGTLGKVAYVERLSMPATLNAGVFNVRVREGIDVDSKYLFHYLKAPFLLKYANAQSTGGTIKHLNQNVLVNFPIPLPIIEEQIKIGTFFKQLDDTITLHQQKYDQLIQLKKAYLDLMFPKTGESTPQVRFVDFHDNWEQRKVFHYGEKTYGGGTPKTSIKEFWNGELPWIQSSDLSNHQVYNVNVRKKITSIGLEKSAAKLIPKNSIAIVTRVGVGKVALIPFNYTTSQDFLSLSNLKINKWFAVYSLYKKMQKEVNTVQGTSIKGITKEELLQKNIRIPISVTEQSRIGNFLKSLDWTITLHQKKIASLKSLKQAYLQKMFV